LAIPFFLGICIYSYTVHVPYLQEDHVLTV
jgi:hypothetical protein